MSFSDHMAFVVCPSVFRPTVYKFFTFHLLLKNQWANFNQTSLKASFGDGDSSFLNERSRPFSRGYIYQIAKIH